MDKYTNRALLLSGQAIARLNTQEHHCECGINEFVLINLSKPFLLCLGPVSYSLHSAALDSDKFQPFEVEGY